MKFAFTLCLVAVLAITAEARHVKKTRTRGNAKMLSLIEKMKQRVPAPRAQVRDDCPGGQICLGDQCCPYADWTCCDGDSGWLCALDPADCDDSAIERTKGNARMNPLLMKMKMHAPEVKAHVADDDDCDGQVCPGDWCCRAEWGDMTCCDEDSAWICQPDADSCDDPAPERTKGKARMNPLLKKMKMHAPEVKAHVADDDDCDGQVCPGDWCCPAEYSDWTCCDADSDYICALDPADC